MNDSSNSAKIPVIALLIAVACLTVAGVVGFVITRNQPTSQTAAEPATRADDTSPAPMTFEIVFRSGSDALPPSALETLAAVVIEVQDRMGSGLVITPIHGEGAPPQDSQRQAAAVEHALLANGVPPKAIQIAPARPVERASGAEANRVIITVN